LSAARRARDLEDLAGGLTVDLLVIGGGVTGTGVALDAAARGLSVALVERRDLAHGTSRWSSKLVHGGLRYLAGGDVALALESARERHLLLTAVAPHLVRPLPMLLPVPPDAPRGAKTRLLAAARAADGLRRAAGTSRAQLPGYRWVGAEEAGRLVPALAAGAAVGGLLTHDGQLEDDARLVVALARTAAGHGARVVTYCAASGVRGDGATLRDERLGAGFEVSATAVVNATGIWAADLDPGVALRPSKGAHLVLRGRRLGDPTAALTVAVPGEGNRYVFALPQPDGDVYLGLTDDPVDGPPPEVPTVDERDETFLLATLSSVLAEALTPADVVGSFAGLRPLAAGGQGRSADLSRRHVVRTRDDGLVTVYGGKLTTYRKMAEDAVDAVLAAHPELSAQPCRTRRLPLVGAAPPAELAGVPARARLVRRYGTEAPAVAALAADDPTLLDPVAAGLPVLGVELRFGLEHEGALGIEDLLERRTRLSLVPADADLARPAAQRLVERYATVGP
jgi:glycerol-3-phosphate dehydrogenase